MGGGWVNCVMRKSGVWGSELWVLIGREARLMYMQNHLHICWSSYSDGSGVRRETCDLGSTPMRTNFSITQLLFIHWVHHFIFHA